MRRLALITVFFLGWVSVCLAAPFRWKIDRMMVFGSPDSLVVSASWSFSEGAVGDNSALVICPSLKGDMGEVMLTPVCLYGEKLYYGRVFASGSSVERRILKGKEPVSFESLETFQRQEWMDTVRLSLTVYEWNRHDGLVPVSMSNRWRYTRPAPPAAPEFPWETLVPEKEKTPRSVELSSPVRFRDFTSKFDIHEGTNEEDMAEFLSRLKKFTSSKTFSVKGSSLLVSLPPYGDPKETIKRSRSCSESLYSYLQRAGAFRVCVPRREGLGQDWDAVREWVMTSPLQDDERLMEILSMDTDDATRLDLVRREKPVAFEKLSDECFPFVGKAVYRAQVAPLSFNNRSFYRPVFDDLPEAMSPYDFCFLASEYGEGTSEWFEVMQTGAALNVGCPELQMDVAMAYIKAGNPRAAAPYLRNIGESDNAKYVYGVWLFASGRYDEALDLFDVLRKRSPLCARLWVSLEPFLIWKTRLVMYDEHLH